MENTTHTTFTHLADIMNTSIKDQVFCSMIDSGIDPGVAWNGIYLGEQQTLLSSEVEVPTDVDDYTDLESVFV